MGDAKAVIARLTNDLDTATDSPGAFELVYYPGDLNKPAGMGFICPCGCGRDGYLPFRPHPSPSWSFDGNEDRPTLSPSVQFVGGCQWHGWLKNGQWIPC